MSHHLEKYIRAKELEVENVKLKQKAAHFMKISSLHMRENDVSYKIMNASNSFNRTSYLLMRANNMSHQDMHDEYENLTKLNQRQGAVKFNENDESDEPFAHLTIPLYEISPQKSLKREHTDSESSSEFQGEFRRPSRKLFKSETSNQSVQINGLEMSKPSNLNETLVLSSATGSNLALPVINPGLVKKKPPLNRPVILSNKNKENSSTLGLL